MIFLGAGASTVLGTKTLQQMSKDLMGHMNDTGYGVLVRRIQQNLDRFGMAIDFENLYTIVEAMVDPKSAIVDAGPFAAYICKDLCEFADKRNYTDLLKHFRSFIYEECKFKREYYSKLPVYDSLFRFADSRGEREERYLSSTEGPKGDVGVGETIVTTNYDMNVEVYYRREETRKKCVDGFRSNPKNPYRSEMDMTTYHNDPQGIWLIKLHGSIWQYSDGKKIFKTIEDPKGSSVPINIEEEMLIFPTKEKHILRSPYYDFYHLFKIQKWKTLISIGYSFRDEAVNVAVLENLQKGKDCVLIVIDPDATNISSNLSARFQSELKDRIIPINAKFGEKGWPQQLDLALRTRNRTRFSTRLHEISS